MNYGSKTAGLRDMQPGDAITKQLNSVKEVDTYIALAWRYSNTEGKKEGKYIHANRDYDECKVVLVCTTWQEWERDRLLHTTKRKWRSDITDAGLSKKNSILERVH